jgi:D-aminoacyl-tRNA deacylase
MYLVVICKQDPASMNIQRQLFKQNNWSEITDFTFDGNKTYRYQTSAIMITIDQYHLYVDDLDQRVNKELEEHAIEFSLKTIIFASKHKSASGLKTLTVHPVGNYHKAEFGGKSEELAVAAPHVMTMAFRILYEQAKSNNLDHSVTFEATHHGPYLESPSFFIEIGSDESAWDSIIAGQTIAQTINRILDSDIGAHCKNYPVAIGVGGGHYAPRHSDVARKKRISYGHIIPTYALTEISERMLASAVERTPEAKFVYFHRKALKKELYRNLKGWYDEHGYEVVKSDDLEDI